MPKGERHHRNVTLDFQADGAVDLYRGPGTTEEATRLAHMLKHPSWRLLAEQDRPETPPQERDCIPKNMVHPRVAPAWLKHDRQVLRFYAFFQESVVERNDENSRIRNLTICYHMEDGTIRIQEPRVENSGIPQGAFLKRQHMAREDGQGFLGPDDFRCGQDIAICGRIYHVSGCDRFTRWFYEMNGIDVGEDEPLAQDDWQRSYRFRQAAEKGGLPPARCAVEAKTLTKFQIGEPPPTKIMQWVLNDRKVLRFKGYWDDETLYGARTYFVIHFYLSDNTVEINEAHSKNAGRDKFPVFMKRGPLLKKNETLAVPAMLTPDPEAYLPQDFLVGEDINVLGRRVVLYDCDDFTRGFYKDFMGIDQFEGRLDVSEKPLRHRKLLPPPHNGIGNPEDSLTNCKMIQPKPPKVDLVRQMTLSGEVLRFEATMDNGEPEDETRRMIIGLYPETDPIQVSVFEMQSRNSGHMAGTFAKRRRMTNPRTGRYFEMADFFVGQTVTISAQPLKIVRADEHALAYMENHPREFPVANPVHCAQRLSALAGEPEMRDESGIDPDRLHELAQEHGIPLVDHEIITLLRRFPASMDERAPPRIDGSRILKAILG